MTEAFPIGLSPELRRVHALAHRAIPTDPARVYVHILDEEVLYYIMEPGACNCKDCVRIEPKLLTEEEVLRTEQSD